MSYQRLNFEMRCHLYGLWKSGQSQTKIAEELGVHKSTISRELRRNITFVRTKLGSWQYKPAYAQHYADGRRHQSRLHHKFTAQVQTFVEARLKADWSPEQSATRSRTTRSYLMQGSEEVARCCASANLPRCATRVIEWCQALGTM